MTIKRYIRNLFAGSLGLCFNVLGLVEKAACRISPGHILPLCFHNPDMKLFTEVVLWLEKNGFTFISSAHLQEIIEGGVIPSEKMVWLSFDDGWRDNMINVLPTLREHNIPATFFITTATIERDDGVFWFSYARMNRNYLPEPYRSRVEDLWGIPESQRKIIIDTLKGNGSCVMKREAFTIAELQTLARLPNISIGAHTDNHPITANCTDLELTSEIVTSKNKLETWLDQEVLYFAYPKGIETGRERDILIQHGYTLATIINDVIISPDMLKRLDKYRIPRVPIPDDGYFTEIICHLVCVWQPFMRFIKRML